MKAPLTTEQIKERLITRSSPRLCPTFFATIPDDFLLDEVCAHIDEEYPQNESESDVEYFDRLSAAMSMIVMIKIVTDQVANGGFNQFLFNRGDLAPNAVQAIEKICGEKHAAALKTVLRHYAYQEDIHIEAKRARSVNELLSKFSETYDSMDYSDADSDWYKNRIEREQTIVAYIKSHASELYDNPDKLAISDWLNEPKQYYSDLFIYSLDATREFNWDDTNRQESRYRELLYCQKRYEEFLEQKKYPESEILLKRFLRLARSWGMEQSELGVKAVKDYSELLKTMGRDVQAEALTEGRN